MEYIINAVNSLSPESITLIAAGLAIGVQYLVNRFLNVRKFINVILGLAAFPAVVTFITDTVALASIEYPIVAIVGQVLYHSLEAIKRNAVASVVSKPEQTVVENPAF